jgi:nucleotide-binding universal stress UspA family protein
VLLVHVHLYGRLSDLLSGGSYEQLVREFAESTFMAVQDMLDPAVPREMRLVSNASPAAGVHAVAEEVGASLIVVGSSHRFGLGRVLAGSVAESVLTGAPVAVAIAPHGYAAADTGLTTIGCGFDGSPESHEALAWAHALARRRRAHLRALAIHSDRIREHLDNRRDRLPIRRRRAPARARAADARGARLAPRRTRG